MNIAIIGCGVVGSRRARIALAAGDTIVGSCDRSSLLAERLADEVGGYATTEWGSLVMDDRVDCVVVATTHEHLAPISAAALSAGRHVLCEKPGGLAWMDIAANGAIADSSGLVYQIGYTHRHHKHIVQLAKEVARGTIGEPYFARAVLGNGGRAGFEQEWRAKAAVAGGGVVMDLGVHLLDLTAHLLGPLQLANAELERNHWRSGKDPVEDNAMLTLRGAGRSIISLHASWTQWVNRFEYEVYGQEGSLEASGLGGLTYGAGSLTVTGTSAAGARPQRVALQSGGEAFDASWVHEWEHFAELVLKGSSHETNYAQASNTLKLVRSIYDRDTAQLAHIDHGGNS